jgi:hypothetical protein
VKAVLAVADLPRRDVNLDLIKVRRGVMLHVTTYYTNPTT